MTKREETEQEMMERLADDFAAYCRKMYLASEGRIVAVAVRDEPNDMQAIGWYSALDPHTAKLLCQFAVDAANEQEEAAGKLAMAAAGMVH